MIYTFYSYKGGVGRSMALANIAEWFYRRGLNVVIVDWDLEAPGLEGFFYAANPTEAIRETPGLVDMIESYKRRMESRKPTGFDSSLDEPFQLDEPPNAGEWINHVADSGDVSPITTPPASVMNSVTRADEDVRELALNELLHPIERPDQDPSHGSLKLLHAGKRGRDDFASYARAVQDFDWAEFYDLYDGEAYFNRLREQLLADGTDIVLIDSRTGVTEMGGVCARQMADVVVSFCAPNDQNLDGVQKMNDSFTRDEVKQARGGKEGVKVVVVPARVDVVGENDLLVEFEKKFKIRFPTEFWELQIPYVTKYAFKETLTIGDPYRSELLEESFVRLAAHLAHLEPVESNVRAKCKTVLKRYFGRLDETRPTSTAPHLRGDVVERPRELAEVIKKLAGEAGQQTRAATLVGMIGSGKSTLAAAVCHDRHVRRAFTDGIFWACLTPDSTRDILDELSNLYQALTDSSIHADREDVALARVAEALAGRNSLIVLDDVTEPAPALALIDACPTCSFLVITPFLGVAQALELPSIQLGGLNREAAEQLVFLRRGSPTATQGLAAQLLKKTAGHPLTLVLARHSLEQRLALGDELPSAVSYILDRIDDRGVFCFDRESGAAEDVDDLPSGSIESAVDEMLTWPRFNVESDVPRPDRAEMLRALALINDCGETCRRSQTESQLSIDPRTLEELEFRSFLDPAAPAEFVRLLPFARRFAEATLIKRLIHLSPPYRHLLRELPPREPHEGASYAHSELREVFARATEHLQLRVEDAEKGFERVIDHLDSKGLLLKMNDDHIRISATIATYIRRGRLKTDESDSDRQRARDFLRGAHLAPRDVLSVAKRLKAHQEFKLARRMLGRVRRMPESQRDAELRLVLAQQHALCTYKDPDLPVGPRLDRALGILEEVENLETTQNEETLGLTGAVFKRKWAVDSQKRHLERSAAYYSRGHRVGRKKGLADDYGYTGINAAFVLDSLAHLESIQATSAGVTSQTAATRRREARLIRRDIIESLTRMLGTPDNQWLRSEWWFLVTLAEAHFGLGEFNEATIWLRQATRLKVAPWEHESTAQQLATLARMQQDFETTNAEIANAEARLVLRDFLRISQTALRSVTIGKTGLALSGGGFRASLFHIGVLARLAELDVLRSVEVLSCVSGGSIVGAHYYLEVRRLMETKPDNEIEPQDYVRIVERVAKDFLAGVQRNIRTRVVTNLWLNLKMLFWPRYSRTQRLGELYEKLIYSRVDDEEGSRPRRLNELFILPKGEGFDFKPKHDNWRRKAKVPILILNATSLNTGHNWQFTASWMGEPPLSGEEPIDASDRLRRMYYHEAPREFRDFRLGYAVAASSCVPGLFEPLTLRNLYPGLTLRLVDGGVHDNQGTSALLDQDCTVIITSDASGQMASVNDPGGGVVDVPLRSMSVLQSRVRETQYLDQRARLRSSLLRGSLFLHLTRDIFGEDTDWVDCEDPAENSEDWRLPAGGSQLTTFGVRKDVQRSLAEIRTDLDSFSEVEARALMTSGYRMAERLFPQHIHGYSEIDDKPARWSFLDVDRAMKQKSGNEAEHDDLQQIINAGRHTAFKIWRLALPLKVSLPFLLVALISTLAWISWKLWSKPLLHGRDVVYTVLAMVATALFGAAVVRTLRFKNEFKRMLMLAVVGTLGWIAAWIHLGVFDPAYLQYGERKRLGKSKMLPRLFAVTLASVVLGIGTPLLTFWNYWENPARAAARHQSSAEALETKDDSDNAFAEWKTARQYAVDGFGIQAPETVRLTNNYARFLIRNHEKTFAGRSALQLAAELLEQSTASLEAAGRSDRRSLQEALALQAALSFLRKDSETARQLLVRAVAFGNPGLTEIVRAQVKLLEDANIPLESKAFSALLEEAAGLIGEAVDAEENASS